MYLNKVSQINDNNNDKVYETDKGRHVVSIG